MGDGLGAWTTACALCPYPRQTRTSDRRRRRRKKACGLVLAFAQQGSRLPLGGPALVAKKIRDMELASGQPMKKGGKPGSAYAYNVKALRNQEMTIAENAERAYELLVASWQPRRPKDAARGRLKTARRE